MGSDPSIPTADKAASSPRHVLPSDLPAAIKHLSDQELDQLLAAVIEEQLRRGKKPPSREKTKWVEAAAVSLTPAKLNAVRAAFKAGVRPSKIAKQFGLPRTEVRKVISSGGMKKRSE
jgi:DNA invertase Pin-like site-specific DNA recombinase